MAWSLDPFLHPLVTELEDIFIDGKSTERHEHNKDELCSYTIGSYNI